MRRADQTSRRRFLAALAALGASSMDPLAKAGAASVTRARRIDVHHHYFPPAMLEAQQNARAEGLSPDVRAWTPARSLAAMDDSGVATAIISTSSGAELRRGLDQAGMRRLARTCNEYAARMASDHPGRYGFFTFLPLPDIDGSLAEIQYGFDTLGADGVGMMTSYGDKWPGDASFEPVLAELDRRRANVFVHPLAPDCCGNLVPNVGNAVIEYPYDSGRAVLSLLFNGRLAKYRQIRWIFCHAGGPIPMLAGRIAGGARNNRNLAAIAPDGIDAEFRRLYYETANSAFAPTMAALLKFAPVSQILFGSDFPYIAVSENVERMGKLSIPTATRKAIERANAARLFPRAGKSA